PNAFYQRSPDGKFEAKIVAEGQNEDLFLHLRETATGREIRRLPGLGEGNSDSLNQWSLLFTFSPDSKTLAAVEEGEELVTGNAIQLFDVTTGELLPQNRGVFRDFFAAAFSPDGRPLVVARVGKTVGLWDVAAAKELYRFNQFDKREWLDRSDFLFS